MPPLPWLPIRHYANNKITYNFAKPEQRVSLNFPWVQPELCQQLERCVSQKEYNMTSKARMSLYTCLFEGKNISNILCSVYSTDGLVLALIFRYATIIRSCSILGTWERERNTSSMTESKIKILGFEELERFASAPKIAPFP